MSSDIQNEAASEFVRVLLVDPGTRAEWTIIRDQSRWLSPDATAAKFDRYYQNLGFPTPHADVRRALEEPRPDDTVPDEDALRAVSDLQTNNELRNNFLELIQNQVTGSAPVSGAGSVNVEEFLQINNYTQTNPGKLAAALGSSAAGTVARWSGNYGDATLTTPNGNKATKKGFLALVVNKDHVSLGGVSLIKYIFNGTIDQLTWSTSEDFNETSGSLQFRYQYVAPSKDTYTGPIVLGTITYPTGEFYPLGGGTLNYRARLAATDQLPPGASKDKDNINWVTTIAGLAGGLVATAVVVNWIYRGCKFGNRRMLARRLNRIREVHEKIKSQRPAGNEEGEEALEKEIKETLKTLRESTMDELRVHMEYAKGRSPNWHGTKEGQKVREKIDKLLEEVKKYNKHLAEEIKKPSVQPNEETSVDHLPDPSSQEEEGEVEELPEVALL